MRMTSKDACRGLGALAAAVLLCAGLVLGGCAAGTDSQQDAQAQDAAATDTAADEAAAAAADELRIGSLKGPTSIGLAAMMEGDEGVFTVAASTDEIAPQLLQGQLDIALVPANLAATLYQKTEGAIRVLDVNTLGVLYAVSAADVSSIEQLRGRTVYMTGKGAVPEYTVQALLAAAGLEGEADIQFCSEPTEVVARIAQDAEAVGILPQPYAAAASMKDEALKIGLDLTSAWEEVTGGERGSIVTGVTIALADTVESQPDVISVFLRRHAASAEVAQSDPAAIASEVVELGIIENAQLAQAAIPLCNVVCLTGDEMQNALQGYLESLYDQDPAAVGGALPDSSFYYHG